MAGQIPQTAVYCHSQKPESFDGTKGQFRVVEEAIERDEWPYDNGDDPSFYVANQGGVLTWGVCRQDVRNSIPMGSVKSRQAGSWRRSALLPVLPHNLLDLRETRRTVRVRERKLGWTHAMGLAIRPLTYPAFKIRGCSRLVLNESAGTTGGEQRRGDEGFSHRSRRRLTSGLCEQRLKKHTPPPYSSPVREITTAVIGRS